MTQARYAYCSVLGCGVWLFVRCPYTPLILPTLPRSLSTLLHFPAAGDLLVRMGVAADMAGKGDGSGAGGTVAGKETTPSKEMSRIKRMVTGLGMETREKRALWVVKVRLIRTSIYDKYSGSMKITTHLDRISHCKTASGTNWSNGWTYRVFTPAHRVPFASRLPFRIFY